MWGGGPAFTHMSPPEVDAIIGWIADVQNHADTADTRTIRIGEAHVQLQDPFGNANGCPHAEREGDILLFWEVYGDQLRVARICGQHM